MTIDIRDFGAIGDGVTDDTSAIKSAIEHTLPGATVFIPRGQYVFKEKLVLSKPITLCGVGEFSALMPDFASPYDDAIYSDNIGGLVLKDFSIMGDRKCKNALVLSRASRAIVSNLTILTCTSEWAFVNEGSIYCQLDIRIHNFSHPDYKSMRPLNGILFKNSATTAANANRLTCYISWLKGYGIKTEGDLELNNNMFYMTIEGIDDGSVPTENVAFHAENLNRCSIQAYFAENRTLSFYLINSRNCILTNVKHFSSNDTLVVQGCAGTVIDASWIGSISRVLDTYKECSR